MTGRELLGNWLKTQETGIVLPCPRCGRMTMKEDVSDNYESIVADVHVCDDCHNEEKRLYKVSSYMEIPALQENDKNIENWWLLSKINEAPKVESKNDRYYHLSIERTIKLSDQDIDDIMASALEGGINYWCCKAEVIEDKYLGEYASEQISRRGSLRLYDSESNEVYELTLDRFITGFVAACKAGYGYDWFDHKGCVDAYNIDADAADTIVQFALFGELVYG